MREWWNEVFESFFSELKCGYYEFVLIFSGDVFYFVSLVFLDLDFG